MSNASPHAIARKTAATLLTAARDAGWARVTCQTKPDGSVTVDAGMVDNEPNDEFLDHDLRMGK